jgi:hypothetical protein
MVPVVLVIVLLWSLSWTSGHPCCSPFPPHEQLVMTMVRGAAGGCQCDLHLCCCPHHPHSPSSSVALVVHPVSSCSQQQVWVLGHHHHPLPCHWSSSPSVTCAPSSSFLLFTHHHSKRAVLCIVMPYMIQRLLCVMNGHCCVTGMELRPLWPSQMIWASRANIH